MKLTMTARRTAMSGKPRRAVAFLKSIGARGAGAKPGSPLVWFALNLPCNLSLPEGQDCPSWVARPPPGGRIAVACICRVCFPQGIQPRRKHTSTVRILLSSRGRDAEPPGHRQADGFAAQD